jgi:hypothetical protein
LITKRTKIVKRFTISIGLTAHTEDEAVGMAADDTTSVEEATMAMATITVATVAMATMAWATVAVATMAAITIGEATREEAKEDTKAFNRRNATYATNQDAGLTSTP